MHRLQVVHLLFAKNFVIGFAVHSIFSIAVEQSIVPMR